MTNGELPLGVQDNECKVGKLRFLSRRSSLPLASAEEEMLRSMISTLYVPNKICFKECRSALTSCQNYVIEIEIQDSHLANFSDICT